MLGQPIDKRYKLSLQIGSFAVLILIYTALSYHQHQKNPADTTIPSWGQLAHGISKIVEVNRRAHERWLVVDAVATGGRLFLGMFLGVLGAFIL